MRYFLTTLLSVSLGFGLGAVYSDEAHFWYRQIQPWFHNLVNQTPVRITTAPAPSVEPAGDIEVASGSVTISSSTKSTQQLARGDDFSEGDIITTGANSSAKLQMNDGETIYLKANSRLRIDQYSEADDTSIKTLLRGRLRAITGSIGNGDHDTYQLHTPINTIGIRGTEYGVAVCLEQACRSSQGPMAEGVYMAVISGKITAKSAGVSQAIGAGETFHQADSNSAAKAVPAIAGLVFDESEMGRLSTPNTSWAKQDIERRKHQTLP